MLVSNVLTILSSVARPAGVSTRAGSVTGTMTVLVGRMSRTAVTARTVMARICSSARMGLNVSTSSGSVMRIQIVQTCLMRTQSHVSRAASVMPPTIGSVPTPASVFLGLGCVMVKMTVTIRRIKKKIVILYLQMKILQFATYSARRMRFSV